MRKDYLRVLIFKNSPLLTESNKEIILRKHNDMYEYDIKFANFQDAEFFLRVENGNEVFIMTEDHFEENNIKVLEDGIKLIEEEKYWIAHEYFEILWRHYKGEQSNFFHSVVLLCVAMVHHQMSRELTKIRIYQNALNELKNFINVSKEEYDFNYPLPSDMIKRIYSYGKEIILL